jgi:SAM-dependent methyltransferase
MARRGFSILGLELSSRMAAFAAAKLKDFPTVEIRNLAFEEWKVSAGCFDIVLAAQAFHWVRPTTGFSRSARALKPGGHLALLWNFGSPGQENFRGFRGHITFLNRKHVKTSREPTQFPPAALTSRPASLNCRQRCRCMLLCSPT